MFASKAKINVFEKNFNGVGPKGASGERKKFQKNVDFSLRGNGATTQSTFFDIFKSKKKYYGEKK